MMLHAEIFTAALLRGPPDAMDDCRRHYAPADTIDAQVPRYASQLRQLLFSQPLMITVITAFNIDRLGPGQH